MSGMKATTLRILCAASVAVVFATSASALNVVYDGRTPQEHREWAERNHLPAHMEVAARRICTALYGNEPRSRLYENFTITLYLAPTRGGNPAFASGRRITWKVGEHPSGTIGECPGILVHEMTHVLDIGSDRVFTEAMADWVRYYMVCTNPAGVLDRRHGALRGGRNYGKYAAGANFLDFMTQNYGEGTIYRILQGYAKHHGKVWENVFGKTFDGLVDEWRQMETIYDPVFQWTYTGTAEGKRRWDGKFCGIRSVAAKEASDKSGAWIDGATAGRVNNVSDGSIAIALHGRFPSGGNPVAIASLGAAKEGEGKAVMLASGQKRDMLFAHVVATVHGKPCAIVATRQIPVPALATKPHAVVLSVAGGNEALISVDGKTPVVVDMKTKCAGCSFAPVFAVGGMSGGIGVAGIAEARGEKGICIDDMRVFARAFRKRETADYAAAFGPDYRAAVAVSAEWCGKSGAAIDDPGSWRCFNSIGERVGVLPSKDTVVRVWGRNLPSVPPKSKFSCKSFVIDGIVVVEDADVDLRGAGVVELADNTHVITRNGHRIALASLRANSVHLDGMLAVTDEMNLSGKLGMKGGSVLRLPADPGKASAKSISTVGDGAVTLMPGSSGRRNQFQKIIRLEEMPNDMSRFRLGPSDGPDDADFKAATGGKFLGATPRKVSSQ